MSTFIGDVSVFLCKNHLINIHIVVVLKKCMILNVYSKYIQQYHKSTKNK